MAAAQVRIIKHEAVPQTGSFEVRFSDGRPGVRQDTCTGRTGQRATMTYADTRPYAIAVCGFAGLALSVSIADAAEIKSFNLKDDSVEISISGNIAPGDIDALRTSIKAANDTGKLVTSLRLNSEGGNLLEAVRVADWVKSAKISTNVGQSATCASACFLIFAAGETKNASNSARIGVHGASEKGVVSRAATTSMADVAKELDVPWSIIRRMINTPPGEVEWLNLADLRLMGTTVSRDKER